MRVHRAVSVSIGLVVLCIICYAASLRNGFTYWDDADYVLNNPEIQTLSFRSITRQFSTFYFSIYHPLTYVSYLLEYHMVGARPLLYHLNNLILHAANCVLAYLFLLRLGKSHLIAGSAAAIFACHPLSVEPVCWIASRKDLLFTAFYVSGLLLYTFRPTARFRPWYLGVLACFVFSLLSKASAITFPLVLLLLDWLGGRRFDRKCWLEKAPFLLLSLVFALTAMAAQRSGGTVEERSFSPGSGTPFVVLFSLGFYFLKAVVPLHLSALYPTLKTGALLPDPGMNPWLVVGIGAVATASAVALAWRKRSLPVFGLLFFIITLLPNLQFVPLGISLVADRYAYLPLIGLCLAFTCTFFTISDSLRARPALPSVVLIVLVAVLGALAHARTKVWRDGLTLWSDVLAKYPSSHIALNNRAYYFLGSGKLEAAISDASAALNANPRFAKAHIIRGTAYLRMNRPEPALADFTRAVELSPGTTEATLKKAVAEMELGRGSAALADINGILRREPGNLEAVRVRARVHASTGNMAEAIKDARAMLAAGSADPDTLGDAGMLLLQAGEFEPAARAYQRALEVRDNETYRFNLGVALGQMGRQGPALAQYTRILEANPNCVDCLVNRSRLLTETGRPEEAIRDGTRAIELAPDNAQAYLNRAEAAIKLGRRAEALKDLGKAKELQPLNPLVQSGLKAAAALPQ